LDFSSLGKILDWILSSFGIPTVLDTALLGAYHAERVTKIFAHEWGSAKVSIHEVLRVLTELHALLLNMSEALREV